MHERGESYTYQSRHITNIFGVVTWRFLWEYDVVRILTPSSTSQSFFSNSLIAFLRASCAFRRFGPRSGKVHSLTSQRRKYCFARPRMSTHVPGLKVSWLGMMVCWIALCTFSSRLGIIRLWTFIQGIFRSLLNLWVRNDLFVWIRDLLGPSSMMSRWTLKVIRTSSTLG